jgi:alpha-tubulin suppressor-like RCC1 family protein
LFNTACCSSNAVKEPDPLPLPKPQPVSTPTPVPKPGPETQEPVREAPVPDPDPEAGNSLLSELDKEKEKENPVDSPRKTVTFSAEPLQSLHEEREPTPPPQQVMSLTLGKKASTPRRGSGKIGGSSGSFARHTHRQTRMSTIGDGGGLMSNNESKMAQNIRDMLQGQQILKCGRTGKPAWRDFKIAPDFSGIMWISHKSNNKDAHVNFRDMNRVIYGQHTAKFLRANRRDIAATSFSIMYGQDGNEDSLDIITKTEVDFQMWTSTLEYMIKTIKEKGCLPPALLEYATSLEPSSSALPTSGTDRKLKSQKNEMCIFGSGEYGQNSNQKYEEHSEPLVVDYLKGKNPVQVACGFSHTAVLLDSGNVMLFGSTVGTGLTGAEHIPSPILSLSEQKISVRLVSCGNFHSACLDEDGVMYVWGANVFGQLGLGHTDDVSSPEVVSLYQDVSIHNLVCGGDFTMCLGYSMHIPESKKIDRKAQMQARRAAAANTEAQTEDAANADVPDVKEKENDDDVEREVSRIWSWGCNQFGQLGIGNRTNQSRPVEVKSLYGKEVIGIAAGDKHSMAFAPRDLYSWGWNGCRQLGFDSDGDVTTPRMLEDFQNMLNPLSVSCGVGHSALIGELTGSQERVFYTWGLNNHGQLGLNSKNRIHEFPSMVPTISASGSNVEEVSCGAFHTICRTEDGQIYSCGKGSTGQLGHGDAKENVPNFDDQKAFRNISGLTEKVAKYISAGGNHSAALYLRQWVSDASALNCGICAKEFTSIRRRHHCRNCGGIFCNQCSSHRLTLLESGTTAPQRVCQKCYNLISGSLN